MPLIGYFAGALFAEKIKLFDHWIAFALLSFIGAKMIKDSFSKEEKEETASFQFVKMLILAVVTSIDALAVGITFAFFKVNIYATVLIIGVTTFIISIGGVMIGNIFGMKFKNQAAFAGGAVLILLGIKILIENLFFT